MFYVAAAGVIGNDQQTAEKMNGFIDQLCAFLNIPEERRQGELKLLYSSAYGSDSLWSWADQTGYAVRAYYAVDDQSPQGRQSQRNQPPQGRCSQIVQAETSLRTSIGDMLCDHADILVMVWDENVTQSDGATWELIQMARRKRVPCLWISSKTGREYWIDDTVYEPYHPDKLRAFCEQIREPETGPAPDDGRTIPFLNLGKWLYKKFLSRYRATSMVIDSKEDRLLLDDYRLDGIFADGEEARQSLLSMYKEYDQAAIRMNDRYQSVLYWRAILPFITTIFLAIGFYTVSILGLFPFFSETLMTAISCVGFLLYALVNLYVFILSGSETVHVWQANMIRYRQMAELLRVAIHFFPFGISMDLRKLSGGDLSMESAVRRVALEKGARVQTVSGKGAREATEHLEELLSDQIAYHTISRERYARVVRHLERMSYIVFHVGFWLVIARAGLQFALPLMEKLPSVENALAITIRGMSVRTFITTGANMLAMLIPAWATYFSAKLSLGNFRFNRDNHQRMMEKLSEERKNLEGLCAEEENLSAEAMHDIGEGLAEVLLVLDNTAWAEKYRGTSISQM